MLQGPDFDVYQASKIELLANTTTIVFRRLRGIFVVNRLSLLCHR